MVRIRCGGRVHIRERSYLAANVGVFALALVCGRPLVSAAVTTVSTCGELVSGSAVLAGDLDCSATGDYAVTVDGGTLDLAGYTITGHATFQTIRCTKTCTIRSEPPGGTVMGGLEGVVGFPSGGGKANVRLRDVVVSGSSGEGVSGAVLGTKVSVIGSTISNHAGHGIAVAGRVSIRESVLFGNGGRGATGSKLKLKNSSVTGNGLGVAGGSKLSIVGSTIAFNAGDGAATTQAVSVRDSVVDQNDGSGVSAFNFGRVKIKSTEITNNGEHGITAGDSSQISVVDSMIVGNALDGIDDASNDRLKIASSTISGNGLNGIRQDDNNCSGARITDSTITGNGTDGATCGVSETCADISSCESPSLSSVTCDTSYDTQSGFPGTSWGVCALD